MQIIFGREQAEELRKRYTIFELESFDVEGKLLESFCVIPMEKMPINDLVDLERLSNMHNALIVELRKGNHSFVEQAIEHLMGHFGKELDSFYENLLDRITPKNGNLLVDNS